MSTRTMDRRRFLQTSLAGFALGQALIGCQEANASGIPRRPLGETGEMVSIVALGGHAIGKLDDHNEAISIMHEAIDAGVNFFDNCWDYHDGHSEDVMGRALASDNRRDQVFLMTKVCARDYQGAMQHLDDSLRRLQTDHIDLWQFHGIKYDDDAALIFDEENGAIRAALEARDAGKIRYIGFTGHKDPDFHQSMLDQDFAWDTLQMPLNVLDAHYRSFQESILPQAVDRGIGVIGMKGLAAQDGRIVRDLGISAQQARTYTLSLPVASLVCGIESRENLRQDLEIARSFARMSESELRQLADISAAEGQDGHMEEYKTGDYGCNWHHNRLG